MAKLYFTYAAMNAGKSTTLLQSSFNYRERGMRTILFTAAIDTRAGTGRIGSRIGLSADAAAFDEATDLYAAVAAEHGRLPLHCVFVDEAQFLKAGQVDDLARIVDVLSLPVLCYGLRTDFTGALFEGAARLFALADEIRELKTVCWCGRKATMNLRTDGEGRAVVAGAQVGIGGNEMYAPLCRRHFFEATGAAAG